MKLLHTDVRSLDKLGLAFLGFSAAKLDLRESYILWCNALEVRRGCLVSLILTEYLQLSSWPPGVIQLAVVHSTVLWLHIHDLQHTL